MNAARVCLCVLVCPSVMCVCLSVVCMCTYWCLGVRVGVCNEQPLTALLLLLPNQQ